MFIKEDLYTVTSTTKLYHCWTDKVTKFDSSSFYNWEQDNMPIYDLDERTHYLWEQLGYPTSSIPGVSLVVSADAPDNEIDCNKNIFRTVSAAVEALPKVINYPIVIEIANFGQLGDLILDGLVFGKNGSLEIINRNFARQEGGVSGPGPLAEVGALPPVYSFLDQEDGYNKYNYVSAVRPYIGNFDASTIKFSPLIGFSQASCISISAPIFSSTYDSRMSGVGGLSPKLNGYYANVKIQNNYSRGNLIIDDYTRQPFDPVGEKLTWKTFDLNSNAISENDIGTKDASTINYFTDSELILSSSYWPPVITGDITKLYLPFNGLFYGNKLNKLIINNCKGKIFIRNFFLDGSGYFKSDNFNGVEITNSDVVLENIVSTRYRKAGFKFSNSNITITRGCVATRIYDYDSTNKRKSGDISSIRDYYSFDEVSSTINYDSAAGMIADNSVINFSSTDQLEYDLYSNYLSPSTIPIIPSFYIFEFVKNANGIILNNSTLIGGKSHNFNETVYSYWESCIDVNHNVGYGIISNNSKISLDGRLRLVENINGAKLLNSNLEFEKICCAFNQNIAIESINSNILYNKNFTLYHLLGTTLIDTHSPSISFWFNGQHLNLTNSTMQPFISSSIEDKYAYMDFRGTIKSKFNETAIVEAIKVDKNSNLTLISPVFERSNNLTINSNSQNRGKKGSEIYVTNNSKVNLIGTRYYCTRIQGPNVYANSYNLAAIAVDRNSSLEINGPTVISRFGIDLLADNNSNILIGPKTISEDSTLDLSTVNLYEPTNHTAVELHSTKACIVANNNSVVTMRNLGSTITSLRRSGLSDIYDLSGLNLLPIIDYETFTSGGSMQFYPNPVALNSEKAYTTIIGQDAPPSISETFNSTLINTRGLFNLVNLTTSPLNFSSVTYGGVCVKASNGSIINAVDVNFPCGFWNPSAAYYDGRLAFDSGGACYKTFIWHMADNSILNASLLSVSGLYPSGAGYVGPSGFWTSAAGAAAYGLPSSTPDTSSLSVLDYFGANPSSTAYSLSSATNYGPFRLYFSVNQLANTLVNTDGSGYGIIPQIYAQGYQPSGNLVASGVTNPSSLYMQAWQRNATTNIISASGYYYGKDMVTNPYFQRVILDESAANVFANAKHCAVGKSNNARMVSIYYPYTAVNSGDSAALYGIGSLSVFDIERAN